MNLPHKKKEKAKKTTLFVLCRQNDNNEIDMCQSENTF